MYLDYTVVFLVIQAFFVVQSPIIPNQRLNEGFNPPR